MVAPIRRCRTRKQRRKKLSTLIPLWVKATLTGFIKLAYDWGLGGCRDRLKRGLELNPDIPPHISGTRLIWCRWENRSRKTRNRTGPTTRSPLANNQFQSRALFILRTSLRRGDGEYQKTLEIDPTFWIAITIWDWLREERHERSGQQEYGIRCIRLVQGPSTKGRGKRSGDSKRHSALLGDGGTASKAQAILNRLQTLRSSATCRTLLRDRLQVWVIRRAIDYLNKAYDAGSRTGTDSRRSDLRQSPL